MDGNGSNNDTVTTDKAYAQSKPLFYGNAKISNTKAKYGATSIYMDGSGDYLQYPYLPQWNFGTGDFTVEGWFNWTAHNSVQTLVGNYYNSGSGWGLQVRSDTGVFALGNGDTILISRTWAPVDGTWYHLAACRSGTSLRLFVDGVQQGATVTDSTNITGSPYGLHVGALYYTQWLQHFNGYMDHVRVYKGYAKYTANFDPEESTNSNYLQSSLWLPLEGSNNATSTTDLSYCGHTITFGNSAKISTTQYKYGSSSAFFNGAVTNDYLSVASHETINSFGTGDFTIEAWIYISDRTRTEQTIITCGTVWATSWAYHLCIRNSGILRFFGGNSVPIDIASSSNAISNNTWHHVAVCRASGTTRLFLDGTSVGTPHSGSVSISNSTTVYIGKFTDNSSNFAGYIDNLRIYRGYAKYTGTFTPGDLGTPLPVIPRTGSTEPVWTGSGTIQDGGVIWTYVDNLVIPQAKFGTLT